MLLQSALVDYRVAARLDPDNEAYTKPLSVLIDMQGHLHLDARSYEAAKHCFTDAIKHDKVVVHYWLHRYAGGADTLCPHTLHHNPRMGWVGMGALQSRRKRVLGRMAPGLG